MIKISIVMPVHNAGIYLKEALISIFAQSFQQFELICVDDASNDEMTERILNMFNEKYQNMKLIWLEKPVGAAARNIGFSIIQEEYVIFLDADDIFETDMLKKMYRGICDNEADVCVCGYERWLFISSLAPWNKLCKVKFLKDNNIYFQSLFSCNDFFSCMVMINAVRVNFVSEMPLIFYRKRTMT